jgi:hypothetical protein
LTAKCEAFHRGVLQVWPEGGRNQQTLGELLINFFRYYTEDFDLERHVVCVRRPGPLSKDSKGWAGKAMAVEDPFELDHNLTKGVTKRALRFILECLRRARLHFGLPRSHPERRRILSSQTSLRSQDSVTASEPSIDEGVTGEEDSGGIASSVTATTTPPDDTEPVVAEPVPLPLPTTSVALPLREELLSTDPARRREKLIKFPSVSNSGDGVCVCVCVFVLSSSSDCAWPLSMLATHQWCVCVCVCVCGDDF